MTISVPILPLDEITAPRPSRAVGLERLTRGDDLIPASWVYRDRSNSWDYGRWRARWYEGEHVDRWSYLIRFGNGDNGVCRVDGVNEALRSAGARVDPAP